MTAPITEPESLPTGWRRHRVVSIIKTLILSTFDSTKASACRQTGARFSNNKQQGQAMYREGVPMANTARVTYEGGLHIDYPREYNAAADFIDIHLSRGDGDRIAVIDAGGRYTYRELAEQVNRAGNLLCDLGLPSESRVFLCMLDTVELVAMFWGAIKAGYVPIPVNTLLTTHDYDYMLSDSRARVAVISAPLWDRFDSIVADKPELKDVFVSGGETPPAARSLAVAMSNAGAELDYAPTTRDDVALALHVRVNRCTQRRYALAA